MVERRIAVLLVSFPLGVACTTGTASNEGSESSVGTSFTDESGGVSPNTASSTSASGATTGPTSDESMGSLTESTSAGSEATSSEDGDDLDTSESDAESSGDDSDRAPKSLVIALDGIRPDALAVAETPRLDALIRGEWQDGYFGAYTPFAQNLYDSATVSGPNHATMMTGAVGEQHGVTSNSDIEGGNFDEYPHYLRRLESRLPAVNTACLFTWGPDGLIPSGADYIKAAPDADNVERIAAMLAGQYEDLDGDSGTQWRSGTQPDALFLFLDDGDAAGHGHGFDPTVEAYLEQLAELDGQIGDMLDAIASRPGFAEESWQILVMSDHGGYETNHGGGSATEHTIPFLVVGRDVLQGRLPDDTANRDVVPTVLRHFDVPIPDTLTGRARGDEIMQEDGAEWGDRLVRYYAFDGDLSDQSPKRRDAEIGLESDHDPVLAADDGKFGGYLGVHDRGGGADDASYLTLADTDELELADAFSVSLWFRSHGPQAGDPVIVGDKDWNDGGNPGWVLLANEGANNSFGSNFASTSADRIDLENLDYDDIRWWHLVVVHRAKGNSIVYAGNADGVQFFMALDARGVGEFRSGLPLNLGQDGTGTYESNLAADIDDLAIWERALSQREVAELYAKGEGRALGELLGDFGEPD